MDVSLTKEEAAAIYELLDQLSGSNPENVFAWDGTDDLASPVTSAAVKIFKATGHDVPENLR